MAARVPGQEGRLIFAPPVCWPIACSLESFWKYSLSALVSGTSIWCHPVLTPGTHDTSHHCTAPVMSPPEVASAHPTCGEWQSPWLWPGALRSRPGSTPPCSSLQSWAAAGLSPAPRPGPAPGSPCLGLLGWLLLPAPTHAQCDPRFQGILAPSTWLSYPVPSSVRAPVSTDSKDVVLFPGAVQMPATITLHTE